VPPGAADHPDLLLTCGKVEVSSLSVSSGSWCRWPVLLSHAAMHPALLCPRPAPCSGEWSLMTLKHHEILQGRPHPTPPYPTPPHPTPPYPTPLPGQSMLQQVLLVAGQPME
jgi:hypothetical protein